VGAGQNIPEALVKLAIGIPVPSFTDFRKGIIFIRYAFDMICDRKEFEQLTSTGEL
jgi:carbamoyl-phosphate synthase large subunit